MRALIPTGANSGIEFAAVGEPEPRVDEAVVEVHAFSINRGETFLLKRPAPGWRPGKDVAGVVVRAAADGTGPEVGRRVVAHPESSGWAERVAIPVSRLAPLPDHVSFVDAAALPLAGLTALRLLRVTGFLASKRVLLTGASGGVGHYFVQLAAAQGALVSAVSASTQRGARLLELGAHELLTNVEEANAPFEVALDSVGGESTQSVWHKLSEHGLLVWFGQASQVPPTLDFFDWTGGLTITMQRFSYMDSTHTEAEDLGTLVRLVASQRLQPEIGLVENWAGTDGVIDALLGRQLRGNAVLTLDHPD